jgi:hypothetical protein
LAVFATSFLSGRRIGNLGTGRIVFGFAIMMPMVFSTPARGARAALVIVKIVSTRMTIALSVRIAMARIMLPLSIEPRRVAGEN